MSDDRDKLPPPPVDPLPDIAWARVERAVLAELDVPETRMVRVPRAPWLVPAIAGAGLAAAAAVAFVLARGEDPTLPPPPELQASLPTRVVTGDLGSDLSFGDAHVAVAPRSAVVLDGSAARGVLAVIERGGAAFTVAPRASRPPFTVQAGAATVRVVGTEFVVTRQGGEDADVDVRDGRVEVTCRGRERWIEAGERWRCTAAVTAAASGTATGTDAGTATAIVTGTATATEPAAGPATETASRPRPAAPVVSDQDRFEAAARLERTDPAAAIAGYRLLARGKSAWAGNALYALGRLSFERDDRAAARAALKRYLARFPRGPNAADARTLLDRLSQGAQP